MECLEFQQKINDFLDNRLSTNAVSRFMTHADSCPECMEELELRYMVRVGILERNQDESGLGYDYTKQLNHMLEQTRTAIRRRYIFQIVKYSVTTVLFWTLAALALIQLRVWIIG